MQFRELMAVISTHAIRLQQDDEDLVILGNDDALDDALWDSLAKHKAQLLELVASHGGDWSSPALRITPDMLPLVKLDQPAIDRIVATVPGGVANVQDIYPLAPLQEGMLYLYLAAGEGDLYVQQAQFTFDNHQRLDAFAQALQWVIDRHDILRTSFVWERLDEPVQVVWRQAPLVCEEVQLDTSTDVFSQLQARYDARHLRLDLQQAPLLRLVYARDPAQGRIVALLLFHHMIIDHVALDVVRREIQAWLQGQTELVAPAVPFRNHLARARMALNEQAHETFFREMLGDIDEPTLPWGLQDVHGGGQDFEDAQLRLSDDLNLRLRTQARQLGVSVASLMHLALARVLGQLSGRTSVVFGTVLLGRMEAGDGGEQALGMFINTLPLRVDVGAQSVYDGVLATHRRLSALLAHEQASLALAQRCSALSAQTPLFSAMLNYRHSAVGDVAEVIELAPGVQVLSGKEPTNYPLTLSVDDLGSGFRLSAIAPTGIGAERVCGYVQTALDALLNALEQSPETLINQLPILPAHERQQLLVGFNDSRVEFDLEQTVHSLFEAQVERTPQAIALQADEQSLTYVELNARANRLAHRLRELGVGPDTPVAICVERGPELVIGLLGILKAGGTYVPLDPAYPAERLNYMLKDSAPVAVLAHGATRAMFEAGGVPLLDFDQDHWQDYPDQNPQVPGLNASNLAYVIYTSGSTGTPKGVMVEHRGLGNLLHWSSQVCPPVADGALLQKTPYSFDASVWELFWPLTAGLRLVLARPDAHFEPAYLTQVVREQRISVIQFVPALLQQFLDVEDVSQCTSLTDVFCGGGELTPALARQVRECLPQVRLHNVYGPTETTVDSTVWTLEPSMPVPEALLPIGRPVSNTRLYILDEQLQPLPLGVAGELYIGGVQVARGYLNLASLTAERFLDDPFSDQPNARLYRTGDLCRYRADGNLEYLGRNDDQVKIRGLRIELGEIQARLIQLDTVLAAEVLVREEVAGDPRLVAYYSGEPLDIGELRGHLLEQLPDYMVPTAFVHLDAMPLSPNGKLDRKAMPAPDQSGQLLRGYEAPVGDVECRIAEIWQTLLNVEQVGRHDNFFELGGHSLLAVKLVERMRQQELNCDVRVLFGRPTVAGLAATLGASSSVQVPVNRITPDCQYITPDLLPLASLDQAGIDRIVESVPGGVANVQDIYALAPLQAGILYHHMAATAGDPYVLQAQFVFDGIKSIKAFVRAVNVVIARHDILRSSVVWEGLEEPVQVVWRAAPLALERVDADPQDGDVLQQMQARFDPRHYRLNLGRAPMMRFAYTEDPQQQRWVGILLMHHLMLDHTALEVLVSEMNSVLHGHAAELATPVQYRNYVAQARLGADAEAHEGFFRDMLGDIDEPTLAFGVQDVHGDGSTVVDSQLTLDTALALRLREQARRLGISVASLAHQAWAQVLAQLSGRDEVVFGTVLLGRMQGGEGADRALGLFINTLPLRVSVTATAVHDSVLATHERLAQLLAHEQASLALAQRCSGVSGALPLFGTLLNYRHSAPQAAGLTLDGIELLSSRERSNYPLVVSVDDLGEGLRLSVQAVPGIDGARVCEYINIAFDSLVQALEQTPQLGVDQLSILPPDERRELLVGFNATQRDYPSGSTVHGLFEQHVKLHPQAVAAVHGHTALTYEGLNQRANRLAHHLIGQGVQPGDHVAILLPRSLELLVAQLAIGKCAAAYVPLDINAPAERQAFMVEDCGAKALLTFSTETVDYDVRRIDLDVLKLDAQPTHNADLPQSSESLAYIMYTSGSTGTPKGVMVPHRAIGRLVINNGYADFNPRDRVAFASNPAFDASTMDVWGPLLNGGRLVVIDHATLLDPHAFGQELAASGATILFVTTALFNQYVQLIPEALKGLRIVLCGGERADPAAFRRLLAEAPDLRIVHCYGPTETTTYATTFEVREVAEDADSVPIGGPISNTQVYVLDARQQPVPMGVTGELYIGGQGVALGYLNRPDLTAEKFLQDPFGDQPGALLYRTGDLARWLAPGQLECIGRNDDQVKIRGFRIELGEIENRLLNCEGVKEAIVLARQDGQEPLRLVAYFTAEEGIDSASLREQLQARLPEYMVPSAWVQLDALPLNNNGKVDRKALPLPDPSAWLSQAYEAPQGPVETALAQIWADVLKLEKVGRHDNFFELGGHSLLAVSLIERLRRIGLSTDVRVLFSQPTLAALAAAVGSGREIEVPANRIPADCTHITPDLLSLTELDQASIDRIVATVPGGAANVQEIYPLAPLQEGILYHHLSAEQGDPYLLQSRLAFDSVERLRTFTDTLQQVVARHDILRTSVVHEGLAIPHQVVWRHAELVVQQVTLDPAQGDILEQLHERFDARHYRLDISQAPLLRMVYAEDPKQQRVVAILLSHHLILDHTALEVIVEEMRDVMFGEIDHLSAPIPYRNYVAQARLGLGEQEHETFFREMLGDIDEPTLPLGLRDVQGDGHGVEEALQPVAAELNGRLREQARQLGVSAASLMHLAWAQVLGVLSNRRDVVFGTVMMGRMQGGDGADRALGVFINTLPLRIDVGASARDGVKATHARLTALLGHEHASLALAQRCSGVAASSPLFSALFNYRHSAPAQQSQHGQGIWEGVQKLGGEERTNYPLTLSVDDLGEGFALSVLAVSQIGAQRICSYMHTALEQLVQALEQTPQKPLNRLPILSTAELERLVDGFNPPVTAYPRGATIHAMVEVQAERNPHTLAVIQGAQQLTYGQLNQRANQLAHHLIGLGVQPDDRVALCVRRGPQMLVGLLAILKAGAGYVPVDPAHPVERIAYLLQDSDPVAVLAQASTRELLGMMPVIDLDSDAWQHLPDSNPKLPYLTPAHLAYVIYTSGSTGQPKGVMVEHATLENLVHWHAEAFDLHAGSHTASVAGFGFDAMAWEVWPALCVGATLHLPPESVSNEHLDELLDWWRAQPLQVSFLPTPVAEYAFSHELQHPTLRTLLIGGDKLRQFNRAQTFAVINNYGPTEATVVATSGPVEVGQPLHIGRPMANARIYLLDDQQRPVPVGVTGELYVAGAGVARGYLNRPDLTAERFLADPFSDQPQARMYRTGDLARWLADGNIEYLGRNDDQVKLRGVRVELGEIEAALASHPAVQDAVALVRDGQLLVWFTERAPAEIEALRNHLQTLLPQALIPAAYVRLDALPLTTNGKLDRKALPEPDQNAWPSREYEAPQGPVETALAQIWADVLRLEKVGRHDNFFELGGHSLLAVSLIERLRQIGLNTDVRVLFSQPTLAALAEAVGSGREIEVPANRIPADCTHITPDLLSLAELDQPSIDRIVATVPGGAANVQDIYPLAPLQEGILYHHLSAEQGDPYLLQSRLAFDSVERVENFATALRQVMARHDILRTAVIWQELAEPMQVVWRQVELPVQEIVLDPADGDVLEQLHERFDARHYRLDISQAPLLRLVYARDPAHDRVVAMLLFHHVVMDHTALDVVQHEMLACLQGREASLGAAVPYRNYVAQARLGVSEQEHETFFRDMLGDIDEPTLPFGMQDVQGDGRDIEETQQALTAATGQRLRSLARQLGISVASLFHLAWAQVLAATSGQERVVFGTVLMGRMQGGEGADRALGMFINTLPLRVDLGATPVREGARATHARLSALLGHEHASLALAQRCSGVAAPSPLFSSMLNYRHSADEAQQQNVRQAWQGIETLSSEERTNYPLSLGVDDLGNGFVLTAMTPASIGSQRICDYMQTALENLADALEQAPDQPLNRLPILVGAERQQVLYDLNVTGTADNLEQTVHALFEAQVQCTPQAIALQAGERQLTYAELNTQANRLAHHLSELGVGPDARVAICVERGLELMVGLLGILKAGGAYVPLDPAYPAERLDYMLKDSAPVAVLVHGATRELLGESTALVIDLDQDHWKFNPDDNPQVPGLSASNLAYVIYTSGSTGAPKGVMVEHRGVGNLLHWSSQLCPAVTDGALLQKTPFSFDASVWELFWPLSAGLRLVLARPDGHREPAYLAQVIREQRISVIQFVPVLLQQFLEQDDVSQCSSLTDVFCGGGDLTPALARRVRERLPQVRLHNVYGPTEATVDSTVWTLEPSMPVPDSALPIGRPIINTRLYVLDAAERPVPMGVIGQLFIGGAGVARGYLGLPQLMAERFIPSPFVAGDRLYATGDLVRYRADGQLEFIGRNDFQVKLRGLRLELGEIEAQLLSHPALREAVVLVREERLVAYFTWHAEAGQPGIETLREHLLARLPDYMVPSAFVALDSLPLSPNGKVDRKALPAPGAESVLVREYEPPVGETEVALARLWAEVLKVERVGRHDHFFELGGHSLLAVSLIERMRQIGLSTDVRVLFSQPTLAALAAAVGSGREIEVPANRIAANCTRITPDMLTLVTLDQAAIERVVSSVPGGVANVQDIYPLAPLQEGILYHHLSAGEGDPYLLQSRLAFDSLERLQHFRAALQHVIDRHDVLRTGVVWEGLSVPVQVVWRQAELVVQEVLLDPAAGDILEQLHARFDARHYRLDIAQAPLLRLVYARDPAHGRVVAMLLFHHIVLDHTALEVVRHEMQAYLRGADEPLPAAVPYRNYVAQARLGVTEQEHEAFFRDMLGDIDEPTLPFSLRDVRGDGRGIEEVQQALDNGLNLRLRSQARQMGISVASLFHLAWAQVLAATSGQDNVVFGTVLMGRMQGGQGADRALGMFINTLPLRVDLGETPVREAVKATHQRLTALLGHEHASLALAQRCSGIAAPSPLFSAMLNYRHSHGSEHSDSVVQAWQGIETLSSEERTNYPLSLNVDDLGNGFSLIAMVPADIGAQRICGYMQTALLALVEALEQAPTQAMNRLLILEGAERQRLLFDFNATDVGFDLQQSIHGLFEAQALRTPQAVAVLSGEQRLSYAELNARANRLAHHLRGLGVGPDARVAICVERGLEMVVGLLAILKAGGGYVPLDPAYPLERLAYMLEDSAPSAVLVQGSTRALLGEVAVPVVDLDHQNWQSQSSDNPSVDGLTPQHTAYVIYTSGSTGQPKGVINEHSGVVNRLLWMQDAYRLTAEDSVLQKTPFSFDVSVWEFFWPLMTGARLVMARPGGHKDPLYLSEVIERERITTLHFVPSMLDVFLAHGDTARCNGLRQVMCSGEALPGSLVRRFKQQLPGSGLHNLYGPTEAAVDVTAWDCAGPLELTPDNTPIGKPIANTRMYILDAQQQPVPQGVVGELYIGGVQVARGYLNRPELSAERFLQDPFQPNGRMYRTGDVARYLADGNIEYLGRNDDQVKIRGLRIELGEIQSRLTDIGGVQEAAVLAREDVPGDKRLVAYYTGARLEIDVLRGHLLEHLPDYMVPAVFVHLDALPLSPNGKLDRKALPAPDQASVITREYEAPVGEVETLLAGLWAELLNVERVGRHDNFFELGGHSLLAVSLIGRLRQEGMEAEVRALFEQPTLAGYAAITERMEIVL
ncbi:non-ribosomal peptide synthetase [Pseudomonas fluorescens]|nr:non-ribosomal peptide synthetase [Pseudomonas fluorescens]